jgi:hypothetical protein
MDRVAAHSKRLLLNHVARRRMHRVAAHCNTVCCSTTLPEECIELQRVIANVCAQLLENVSLENLAGLLLVEPLGLAVQFSFEGRLEAAAAGEDDDGLLTPVLVVIIIIVVIMRNFMILDIQIKENTNRYWR